MSITDVRQWKISDGQVILREEGNVTKISICVIQACWSSLTLNSADMASDATVIFCLFYETTWDRCPLVLFPRTPPRDEVVELRVVKVIRERLNQILMNSFLLQIVPSNSHFSDKLRQCVYRLLFPLYSRKWQFFDEMLAESSRHCNAHCVL